MQKIDEKTWEAVRLTEIFDTISRGKRIKNLTIFLVMFRMFHPQRLRTVQMEVVAMRRMSENSVTVLPLQIAEVLVPAFTTLMILLPVTM